MTARDAAADTAFGPMLLAAIEHNEPPQRRLVDDDLAESFLPRRFRAVVALTRVGAIRSAVSALSDRSGPGLWAGIACRKRFIDERLSDPLTDIDAVVVLGAGLDTRAYRIARHGDMPVFEVDRQVNIDRKVAAVERALGAIPPSVRLVAFDFESDALLPTLEAHGYRAEHRTFFIWEGVTQYLSADAVRATLGRLSSAAPGSKLVFTYIRQDFVDGTELYGAESVYRRFRGRNPVWKSGLVPEAVAELLADHGWRLVEQAGPSYYRDTYIRPTGRSVAASPIEWTVLAER
ncbi:S-adenosyl-L-methionine-dependent methyltransferase [Mycolicibacterium parafortuitum]|uniref:S-adenosyl-L-methionine-dependent methyltransferase n=1 Tax=Mycolicibacterium parafortuitum TaxID=39692 RepID=A0A7I7U978_MYCPF|nr:SAM-dependent methyltransferase [Mycolicibacterium parafortuitum]BBY77952.1 S-adenosyl-L-methionine-dependent methyltransferase [Mycolicibacterium parafortuitum]